MNYPHQSSPQQTQHTQSLEHIPRLDHASAMASRSASFDRRTRPDVDSWVDVSSQPSSSSLSSIGDEIVTTGLRVQSNTRTGQRRTVRFGAPTRLNITRTRSADATSSNEEYEESESESDKVMLSSGDEPLLRMQAYRYNSTDNAQTPAATASGASGAVPSDDEDENRTAINYPINATTTSFTPLPNAFSHPPSTMNRTTSQPVPGSYFPASRPANSRRTSGRYSLPPYTESRRPSHVAQNPLSPSFNAAAEHEEVLRASLTSLLSVAAAARGLPKSDIKRATTSQQQPPRSNQINPMSFRLVSESALPNSSPPQLQEPTFKPTLRRTSTASASASTTSSQRQHPEHKRKAAPIIRSPSRDERRSVKKIRRSSPSSQQEDLHITPTLLTWFVSAGVVIVFSALSFTAGYGLGKEAGRLEAGSMVADEHVRSCAREAGRSGLGLKRSLAGAAIQA